MQSTRWVFTINNPTEEDFQRLTVLCEDVGNNGIVYLVYGREVGEHGTPHLQGFVIFSTRKRLGGVRDVLGQRGHYECCRGTNDQAADYCKKDGDFVEAGTIPRTGRERQPTVADFSVWVRQYHELNFVPPSEREIAANFPGLFLRYGTRMLVLVHHILPHIGLVDTPLNDWQLELYNEITGEADDRKVKFIIDHEGGKGKSYFCRYMLTNKADITQVLSVGKRDDLAHAIDVSKRVFLFNMPRGGMELLQYGLLESLKDRIVFSPKYNSTTKILTFRVHVVVFGNEDADMTKMSVDRYDIKIL